MGTVIQRKIDRQENDKYLLVFSRSQKSQDASNNILDLYTKQDLSYDDTILSYKNMSNKLYDLVGNGATKQIDQNQPDDQTVANDVKSPQVSEADKKIFLETLRERMHIIESIGRVLSSDYHITIEKGDGWAYNFGSNTIIYKEDDLIGRSEDYALGVILHETGHRKYSMMYDAAKNNEPLRFLWNAVEDPRINNLMISRYAGAKPFFKAIYDEDLLNRDMREEIINKIMQAKGLSREQAEIVASMVKNIIPRHMQYAFAVIYDWYTDGQKLPWLTDEKAIEVFEKTKDDFRYAISLKRDIFKKDLTLKEVKKQSDEAFKIVQDKLFPEYKKLLEEDEKDMAQSLANQNRQQQPPQQMPPMGGQGGGDGQSSSSGQESQGSKQKGGKEENKNGGQSQKTPDSGNEQQSKQADNKQNPGQQGDNKDESQKKEDSSGQCNKPGNTENTGADQKDKTGSGQKKDDPSGKGDNSSKTDKPGEDKKNKDAQDKNAGGAPETDSNKEQKDKQGAGGNGKADDNKEQKDKQGANGSGKPDKPMPKPTEEDMRAAEKIFEEMEKDISDKLESKEQQSENSRNNMPEKQSSNGKQKNEKSQQGEKTGQGEKSEQGEKTGDKNGDVNKSDDGTQSNQPADDSRSSGNGETTSDIDLPTLQELYEQQRQLEKHIEGIKSPYERYSTELAPFIDEMTGELKNLLEENASPKFVGDFPSGKKINLRRAMEAQGKYEVRGEFDPNVWMRKDLPSSRDYGFVFVLDESGSMMDFDKWENAKKALILCSEALERLKIKFGVVGFSNSPKVHKQINDKYDEVSRERVLADIECSEHGGTNDSDALAVGVNMVKETSSEQIKVVIVISDGEGKEGELRGVIEKAAKEGIKVIGVGIGDGMAYAKKVYPKCLTVPNVQDLPFKLADLLEEEILGGFAEEF